MGILTTIAAYKYGQHRQRRRYAKHICDHCGFHVDDHMGWKRTCPEPIYVYVDLD
jgi:hypothetical protein